MGTLRTTLCIAIIAAFISAGFCCTEEEWQCKSGQCIDAQYLCDGRANCADKSDETAESCTQQICPEFAYRCAYGACVSGDAKCNGLIECLDGSDESTTLCHKPKCLDADKFQCDSGECIDQEKACDGHSDCPDQSDEIAEKCANSCSPSKGGFRCSYGACINKDKICNGISDCRDGSDEIHCSVQPSLDPALRRFRRNVSTTTSELRSELCKKLDGLTFRTECEFNGESVPCGDRIMPGTIARISCRTKYRKPHQISHPDQMRCGNDGNWDYEPYRCEPICGEEEPHTQAFILSGTPANIIEVPWHVGIYSNLSFNRRYEYHCAGTIISEKLVVSAAHCFWDPANEKLYDKSLFIVGAGKYYRDYSVKEANAQFQNISQITIPNQFTDVIHRYQSDIAVIVLTNHLIFSAHIAPICIDWKERADQSIPSKTSGRVAGWGMDETDKPSADLRSTIMETTDCKNQAGEFASAITSDKFCVANRHSDVVCQGDSGGGFTVKKIVGGKNIYHLWGILSNGVPSARKCREFEFFTYTNIQYFRAMIEMTEVKNRVM